LCRGGTGPRRAPHSLGLGEAVGGAVLLRLPRLLLLVDDLAVLVHDVLRVLETDHGLHSQFLDTRDLLVPTDALDDLTGHAVRHDQHLLFQVAKSRQLVPLVGVLRPTLTLGLAVLVTVRVRLVLDGVLLLLLSGRLAPLVFLRERGTHEVDRLVRDAEGVGQAHVHTVRVEDRDDGLGLDGHDDSFS
jgi:hypothetical protein